MRKLGIYGVLAVLGGLVTAAPVARADSLSFAFGHFGRHSGVFVGGTFGLGPYYPYSPYYPSYGYYPYYPYYYYPPPVVYVQPAPRPAGYDRSYCREYQSTAQVNGVAQPVHGIACRQPDGTWRIVS
jgi:hypothetical protein